MTTVGKPLWQQVTALISLSAGGTITGLSFVPRAPADLGSPSGLPVRLAALERLTQSAQAVQPSAPADDAMLRSAIVNVAKYYLQLAKNRSPAEMEALIWQHDSLDGADHGESCAAFASLTLELGAQVVGQQSWVTGGTSYPWPLHKWADVRVDPNPDSLGIISIQQDAQAHGRWHPLGDGYQPQPGDWVLFDGHVEVVTGYSGGVLSTIGGDSLPNYSVNAHEYPGPLADQGVAGFVDNGNLSGGSQPAGSGVSPAIPGTGSSGAGAGPAASAPGPGSAASASGSGQAAPTPGTGPTRSTPASGGQAGRAVIPGTSDPGPAPAANGHQPQGQPSPTRASTPAPGHSAPARQPAAPVAAASTLGNSAAIPGLPAATPGSSASQPGSASTQPGSSAAQPGSSSSTPTSPGASAPAAQSAPAIPGVPAAAQSPGQAPPGHNASPSGPSPAAAPGTSQHPPAGETSAQQAFINAVAPGAMATQRRYGVPAAVTIAQAVLESGWGQSYLASKDHNLFGIKGQGPAGSDALPTQEFVNGQWVNTVALFRVYHNFTESIEDHGRLLATSGYYKRAMAENQDPDAFANALTGVYATDPDYGAKLISLMQNFGLYRYDTAAATAPAPAAPAPGTPTPTSRAPASRTAAPRAPASRSPASRTPASRTPASRTPASRTPASRTPKSRTPAPRTPKSRTPAPRTPASRTPAPRTPTSRPRPATASPAPTMEADAVYRPAVTSAAYRPAASAMFRPAVTTAAYRPAAGAVFRPSAGGAFRPGVASTAYRPATSGARSRQAEFPQAQAAAPAWLGTPGARRTTAASTVRRPASAARPARATAPYPHQIPLSVRNSFIALAKVPLTRAEDLYRDVASLAGIPWELLAACDWMQCAARSRYSPVHGEKLGTRGPDGSVYHTKSEALEQCAYDLAELALAVYQIDLTAPADLSVRDLANVFAAFRWGGLLRRHHTSALEFPYSVAGLTEQHMNMRWPSIDDPNTPDKPGARFRLPFGAVPIVIGLNYPATAA
jgi:flagellum-specific peptidoglycan hydrolase FlgJ